MLISSIALAACGTTSTTLPAASILDGKVTNYEPKGIGKTGFKFKDLGEGRFEVKVRGTTVTNKERVKNIALVRAAETGRELGKSHIIVFAVQDYLSCSTNTMTQRVVDAIPTARMKFWYSDNPNEYARESHSVEHILTEIKPTVVGKEFSYQERQAMRLENFKACGDSEVFSRHFRGVK